MNGVAGCGRLRGVVVLTLSLVLAASPYADARRDYGDLDYEACVSRLSNLRAVPAKERAAAELLLGLCHFALGQEAKARARLEAALRRAPTLTAPPEASPKERALIDEAREAASAAPAPGRSRKTAKQGDGKKPEALARAPGAPSERPAGPPASVPAERPPEAPLVAEASGTNPGGADAPRGPAPSPAADAPVATALVPAPAAAPPKVVVAPAPARTPVATWVAGGAAVAAAGVGLGFGVSARGLEAQGNAEPVQVEAERLRGQAQASATVANVAFAVAGTAAVTAAVTWLLLR